jgi:hypothetical protein
MQNIQCSRIIIAFTVASADAKDKIINVQELLLLRRLKNYCCFYCSEDMRNIELLLPLLFKKICKIFTTVHICNFPFLLAYKKAVRYFKRQKSFEREFVSHLECLSLTFLSLLSCIQNYLFFSFPYIFRPLHQGFEYCIYSNFASIISGNNVYYFISIFTK